MTFHIPKGVFDILPSADEPWRESHRWQHVEQLIHQAARDYGYREIRTPVFESEDLFRRSVGEETDIVFKEMYSFEDRGGRRLALRAEGTAPALRAFIENQLQQQGTHHKLYYVGPMFRYERQQAGRYRQHHQFGVEAIGWEAPEQDAEVIDLLFTLYRRAGLQGLQVQINTLGNEETRRRYVEALVRHFEPHCEQLSPDSQARLRRNPLRVLDSKATEDQPLIATAPSILDFLDSHSSDHFEQLQQCLRSTGIPFVVTPRLVRGLDYYNRTVFEWTASQLGAQNAVSAGGRYDGLIRQLGGPDLPAVGFGSGLERMIQTMLGQNIAFPEPPAPLLTLLPMGDAARHAAFELCAQMRRNGLAVDCDYSNRKLKAMLASAVGAGAQFVAILGDDEIQAGSCPVRCLATREEAQLPLDRFEEQFRSQLRSSPQRT
jgi:histidyl-tRNA synthetase